MIVYIKGQSGQIYCSPVFAEIGKGWDIQSVVLNEKNDALILLPHVKDKSDISHFCYYYIDYTLQDGWERNESISGFPEIIKNRQLIKDLKKGKSISIEGFQCIKLYSLPLPVITNFTIKNKHDVDTFYTVSWGLHDACIEKINRIDNDIIINFDTTWDKHIIMSFHNVKETEGIEKKDIEQIDCILDSEIDFCDNGLIWEISDFVSNGDYGLEDTPYIIAELISWELIID